MSNPQDITVFVVEDNADNMFVITDLLTADPEDGGCGVKHCEGRSTGAQMFGFLASHPWVKPDLILLDIQIPHEDGYHVLQEIRRRPLLGKARIVAVTANVMPPDVDRARRAGFDGFIGKPINPRRFPDQIRRIMLGEDVWEPR